MNPQLGEVAYRPVELGKIAYEAYGENRNWETFGGSRMPSWDKQAEHIRSAWVAAVSAVVAELVDKRRFS